MKNNWNENSGSDYNSFKWTLKIPYPKGGKQIEVEIQIFTKDNFIKAEIDRKSNASHFEYKNKQSLKNMPNLFPPEIYWKVPLTEIIKNNNNWLLT
jgi:hypothetical protein